jgi:hypothetical protein
MAVTLVPLPDGLEGDVEERLQELINAVNGYAGQGIRFNLTAYHHDERYAFQVRNTGVTGGGLHLGVWSSAESLASPPIFEVQDSGVFSNVPVEIDSTLTVGGAAGIGGNLGVTGNLTVVGEGQFHGVITGDSGLDLIGGAEISGIVLLHSQWQSTVTVGAPFTVASSSAVTNLNADLLDGFHASHFATISDLADYVLRAGDTMTGLLTMEPSTPTDAILKLKNSSVGDGMTLGVGVGSNDAASPALIVRDHLGVDMLEIGNSFSSVYYATVKGDFHVQGAADFDSDMTLGNGSGDAIAVRGTATFDRGISVSAVGGSSLFAQPVTIQGLTTIQSGGLDVTGNATFANDLTGTAGTFDWKNGGTSRIKANSTGVGFFGSAPVARPTVVGSRGANAALQSLCSQLANLGLITDLTT